MSKADIFLSRSSHLAQIVLVAVAVFGYFSTVRPAYQKELLAEEVAEKQSRLNKLNEKIAAKITREFIFVVGAECTGLLDPPRALTTMGGDSPPAPQVEVSRYTLETMKECAAGKFDSYSAFSDFPDSHFRDFKNKFFSYMSSGEMKRRVSFSRSPEKEFRAMLLEFEWSVGSEVANDALQERSTPTKRGQKN